MDKLRRALSGDDSQASTSGAGDEEAGFASQFRDAASLDWKGRVKGFAICFLLGFLFSILGIICLGIPGKGIRLFALFYSLGNITSIASTCYLMGPAKQLKKMFNSTRIVATLSAFIFLALTLFSALYLKKTLLTILCCAFQFVAMIWYSISYIPYARDAVLKVLNI